MSKDTIGKTQEELAAQAKEEARLAHIASLAEQSEGLTKEVAPVVLTTLHDLANLPTPEKAIEETVSKIDVAQMALREAEYLRSEAHEDGKIRTGYDGKHSAYMAHTFTVLRSSSFNRFEADKVTRKMVTVLRKHLDGFDSAFDAGLAKKTGLVDVKEVSKGTVDSSCFTSIVHANTFMKTCVKHGVNLGKTGWVYSPVLVDAIKEWLRNFGNQA